MKGYKAFSKGLVYRGERMISTTIDKYLKNKCIEDDD